MTRVPCSGNLCRRRAGLAGLDSVEKVGTMGPVVTTIDSRASWPASTAETLLVADEQRWRHTLGVVGRAGELRSVLTAGDYEALIDAAYLHDIGYAGGVAATGFHPLDGARWVRTTGNERLAGLVAFHSAAREEAEERGHAQVLAEFSDEQSLVSRALTYCDVTTGPDGSPVTLEERLLELVGRRGEDDPSVCAMRRALPRLKRIVDEIEGLLATVR